MLKQSWSVARVILSLPAVFKRTGEAYELPEWLLKKNASLRFSVLCEISVHAAAFGGIRSVLPKTPTYFFKLNV